MPIRKSLVLQDIQLSYLEWPANGSPLLLLHGLADHARIWSAVGDVLSEQYHVVAVDMRGHGDSSKPLQGYDFATVIHDLNQLMVHLGWPSAHVVGHSWSGKIATIWATQQPDRFLSMVLVDPIFVYGLPGLFRLTFPLFYDVLPFLKGMGPFPDWTIAEQQARSLKQYKAWTPLQQQIFRESLTTTEKGTLVSKFTKAARDGIFDAVLRIPGLTQPVAVPTLFLQPEKGVNRFDWQLKPYRKYLTNLKIQKIPGNHWAFLVEPTAFSRTLQAFLKEA